MANHYSYSKDRDLMMEAYASVSGNVPATSSTAMPRMLNEGAGRPKIGSEFKGGTVIDAGAEEDGVIEIAVEKGDKVSMYYYNTATGEATQEENAEGKYPAEDSSCMSDEEHLPAEDGSCANHEDAEHQEPVQACMATIDKLAETLEGAEKVEVYEDLRDYLKLKLSSAEDSSCASM